MDIENCQIKKRNGRKKFHISLRITPEIDTWLIKNNLSPTRIFYEAIRELGFKEEDYRTVGYETYKDYKRFRRRRH